MIESEILSLVAQYGLPSVLVVYLLITRDRIISQNTKVLAGLQSTIYMLLGRIKK